MDILPKVLLRDILFGVVVVRDILHRTVMSGALSVVMTYHLG